MVLRDAEEDAGELALGQRREVLRLAERLLALPAARLPAAAAVLKTKAGMKRATAAIPLKRVATPEEIAGPILFAVSDLATFMTGEVINVNGGSILCG